VPFAPGGVACADRWSWSRGQIAPLRKLDCTHRRTHGAPTATTTTTTTTTPTTLTSTTATTIATTNGDYYSAQVQFDLKAFLLDSNVNFFFTGMFTHLMTFVLFWALAYTVTHVY
jgi:hypothetical protein